MFLYPVLEMVILALQALYYWFVSALRCAQCGWVYGESAFSYVMLMLLLLKFVFQWGDWFYAVLYRGTTCWFQASSESNRWKWK